MTVAYGGLLFVWLLDMGLLLDSVGETGWGPTPQEGVAHNGCHAMLVGGSHLTKIVMWYPQGFASCILETKANRESYII